MTTVNTYGRQVVVPLTNKSGGSVAAGDVVIVDTTNNDAFTTTTSGAFTGGVGIAQETIANNATGRVLLSGYAALVNVNASVTRGNYVKTHTVVKQGTDAGSSRVTGTFGQFLTGGTTPDAIIWQPDLGAAGSSSTTSWVAVYNGSNIAVPTSEGIITGFNNELADTDTYHDTSTHNERLTCSSGKDGVFIWFFNPRFDASKTGYMYVEKVNVSGSGSASALLAIQSTSALWVAGANQGGMSLSGTIDLKATDYIQAQGVASATLNILTTGKPVFGMTRIGS